MVWYHCRLPRTGPDRGALQGAVLDDVLAVSISASDSQADLHERKLTNVLTAAPAVFSANWTTRSRGGTHLAPSPRPPSQPDFDGDWHEIDRLLGVGVRDGDQHRVQPRNARRVHSDMLFCHDLDNNDARVHERAVQQTNDSSGQPRVGAHALKDHHTGRVGR